MSLLEIKESVAQLGDRDKGNLAAWLLDSLPPHGPEESAADSLADAVHRRNELDAGRAQVVSADDFWAAVERERAAWK